MSKRAQYEDYLAECANITCSTQTSLDDFEPECDDCGTLMPEWDQDPDMRVQCDNCNSNNEG